MAKFSMRLVIVFLVLLATYYYLFTLSILFNLFTFVITVAILFAFYFASPTTFRKRINDFLEKYSIFMLVGVMLVALLILYKAELFTDGPVVFQDYSFHYYRTDLMANVLLPKFSNAIGWTQQFQAGMPEFYDYPPLTYFITSSLYFLSGQSLPLTLLFRTTIALGFILPIVGIYSLTRSMTRNSVIALFAAVIWLGFPHNQFIYGNYTTYFALGWAFLGLSFYFDYVRGRKKESLFSSIIFFAFTFLSNPMIIVPTLIVMLFGFKRPSLRDLAILSLGVFAISFIWFVEIYEGYEYLSYIHSVSLTHCPAWFDVYHQFFSRFLYLAPALFFITFLGIAYRDEEAVERLLYSVIAILIFLVAVQHMQPVFDILTLLQPEKTVMFLHGILIIVSVYFSYIFIKDEKFSQNKFVTSIIPSLIVAAFIGSSLVYIPYLLDSWSDIHSAQFIKIAGYYPDFSLKGVFSDGPKQSVIETFEFLKDNVSENSRVLFEDSKSGKLGGSVVALGPYYSGKNFIGGPFYHTALRDQNATAGDGVVLGKKLSEYAEQEFEEKLDSFNIGHLVSWTPQFTGFLKSKPKIFSELYVSEDNLLHVFRYANSSDSYASAEHGSTSVETAEFDDNIMSFKIQNATKNERILIKATYNSHWKGYLDGNAIELEKGNLHLISFVMPETGNHILTIIYEKTSLEALAPFVTVVSFAVMLSLAIFY